MHFLVYPGEKCNLRCTYCDTDEERKKLVMNRTYDVETLKEFFRKVRGPSITFYGGEPTLDIGFMTELMDSVKFSYVSMVTNSFYLDKVPLDYLNRMQMISISVDGTKETTDSYRGKGVYDTVMRQAGFLKHRGYHNLLAARITVSLGNDIDKDVMHLLNSGKFGLVHWQLDVFHEYSFNKPEEFRQWFDESYNPGVGRLVKHWADHMVKNKEVLRIVPFIGIMYTLLTGKKVENIRCGAGHNFWVISTSGKIFSCPIFRDDDNFVVSDITKPPNLIQPQFLLKPPCTVCEIFSVCGGRCLYTNEHVSDKPIFGIVCDSIKYLVSALKVVEPEVRKLLDQGDIKIEDFDYFFEHEVIP